MSKAIKKSSLIVEVITNDSRVEETNTTTYDLETNSKIFNNNLSNTPDEEVFYPINETTNFNNEYVFNETERKFNSEDSEDFKQSANNKELDKFNESKIDEAWDKNNEDDDEYNDDEGDDNEDKYSDEDEAIEFKTMTLEEVKETIDNIIDYNNSKQFLQEKIKTLEINFFLITRQMLEYTKLIEIFNNFFHYKNNFEKALNNNNLNSETINFYNTVINNARNTFNKFIINRNFQI